MEEYKPTQEEIDKAEGTMTETQKSLTMTREKQIKALEKLGVTGYVYHEAVESIEGNLNGHEFEAGWGGGSIDGIELKPEEGLSLYKKYHELAIPKYEEITKIEKVGEELEQSNKEYNEELRQIEDKKRQIEDKKKQVEDRRKVERILSELL